MGTSTAVRSAGGLSASAVMAMGHKSYPRARAKSPASAGGRGADDAVRCVPMRALLCVLCCSCGGAVATAAFQVERPHAATDGSDRDDAAPAVWLAVGASRIAAGQAV